MKRQPLSFLVTILQDEVNPDILRGRIRCIATDEEFNFRGIKQLTRFFQKKAGQVDEHPSFPSPDPLPKGEG